ncbi:MAG TPA: hypothetical protein VFA98_01005, partial [Thermoanaerobaculia bacterium]|nr:hypothetical protein [Thermoanaerobaculia bacterium]
SGCLVERNQVNSFPAVIARATLVPDFEQPLVQEIPVQNPPGTVCLGAIFVPPATITVGPVSQMGPPLNALLPRPYNNLGIPGIAVEDVLTLTHGDPNGTDLQQTSALVLRNVTGSPFDGTNAVMQADALLGAAAGGHTLATVWYGSNNTLGASTSGIVIDGVTLLSQADFQSDYQAIIASIQPSPSRLVLANISDVTSIPFSTTIPPVLVDPTTRQPVLIGGSMVPLLGPGDAANPCTPVPPDQGCALPPGTLVNLPASSLLAVGVGIPVAAGGTGMPLPLGYIDAQGVPHPGVILYPDMIALLQQRTGEYNSVIAATASSTGATLVDMNAVLKAAAIQGYDVGGIHLTTAFLTGGIFGYDGVHPSSIGYSIVADEFLKAMNAQGTEVFAWPNFSDVLFTPNVPATGAGSVTVGGPWGYTYDMWREVLTSVSEKAASMSLPEVRQAAPVVPRRPAPRTLHSLDRSHDARD